ncbi:XRE family transcriptional regulator [Zavarzinia aquatilis]|uniref:XRE family transcriptional regulator n=1 Tax=Zavarzinia aquatilis TaxID=2211142 RepID=A0A317EF92_9PROT|nr:XRE family transcriptional regulator [Zavarzinia aquatilis]PWR24964.1 XRE family transcriptional regulator [Zavarzinia aquatilis]
MQLADWIAANGQNRSSFGRSIGERPMTISRYCLPAGHPHRRIPKEETMRKIFVATGGLVTANDFYGIAEAAPDPAAPAPTPGMEAAE